jgi:hypothetical protein
MGGELQALSMGMSAIPTLVGLADRWRFQSDPLLQQIGQIGINQYNDVLGNNPYGNPMGGWGGQFGYSGNYETDPATGQVTRGTRTPIGFGEAEALATMRMLNGGGANAALDAYGQLGGSQGPVMQDATAGMNRLLGYGAGPGDYQTGMRAQVNMPNPTVGTNFSGQAAPNQNGNPNYRITEGVGGPAAWMQNFMGGGQQQAVAPPGGGQAPTMADLWQQQMGYVPGGGGQTSTPGLGGRGYGGKAMPTGTANATPSQGGAQPSPPPPGMAGGVNQKPLPGVQPTPTAATPTQPGQAPPNVVQQLFASPMAYTPEMQTQLFEQQRQDIDATTRDAMRQMRESAASSGMLNSGAFQDQAYRMQGDRMRSLQNARLGIGQRAAETNFGNLMGAAQLQGGLEQGLAQLQLGQNQQRYSAYNADVANTGRVIDQSANLYNQDLQRQAQMWQTLRGLGQAGMNLPNDYLSSVEGRQARRLMPTPITGGPSYVAGGGGGNNGGGGSSGLGTAIGSAAGMWAAGGFPSPWS